MMPSRTERPCVFQYINTHTHRFAELSTLGHGNDFHPEPKPNPNINHN